MHIVISNLRNADKHLESNHFDALLSIGKPGKNGPEEHCTKKTANNHYSDFWDTTPTIKRKRDFPPVHVIMDIIIWAKKLRQTDNVLAHCKQGRSRSVACGLICYVAAGTPIKDACEAIHKVCPRGKPNWYVLAIADQLMHTNILGTWKDLGFAVKRARKEIELP